MASSSGLDVLANLIAGIEKVEGKPQESSRRQDPEGGPESAVQSPAQHVPRRGDGAPVSPLLLSISPPSLHPGFRNQAVSEHGSARLRPGSLNRSSLVFR